MEENIFKKYRIFVSIMFCRVPSEYGTQCFIVIQHDNYKFDVHVAVHRDTFLIIKPTRCTSFSKVFILE